MITDGLPKSYLVKQDANFEGVKVISVETPFKQRISDFLQKNDDFGPISQGWGCKNDSTFNFYFTFMLKRRFTSLLSALNLVSR